MIHPSVKLIWISDARGYGLVATQLIPKGSITFVQDPLDIAIPPDSPLLFDENIKSKIEKYSYINEKNEFVISWDIAKYMNHCCFANTLTTGWGFEIAIRDIQPGEEVTDDYGLFTIRHDMKISCEKENCRGRISAADYDKYAEYWDRQIKDSLKFLPQVDQPLRGLLSPETKQQLADYKEDKSQYVSIKNSPIIPANYFTK